MSINFLHPCDFNLTGQWGPVNIRSIILALLAQQKWRMMQNAYGNDAGPYLGSHREVRL